MKSSLFRSAIFLCTAMLLLTQTAHALTISPAQTQAISRLSPDTPCLKPRIESSHFSPKAVRLTLYENHNDLCGGAPETAPRYKTYEIDAHGRAFEYHFNFESLILVNFDKDAFKTIDDFVDWQHPTKAVFKRYGATLKQVRLYNHDTFAAFMVEHPLLKPFKKNTPKFHEQQQFFNDLLAANGQWDFYIMAPSELGYVVTGKKRRAWDNVQTPLPKITQAKEDASYAYVTDVITAQGRTFIEVDFVYLRENEAGDVPVTNNNPKKRIFEVPRLSYQGTCSGYDSFSTDEIFTHWEAVKDDKPLYYLQVKDSYVTEFYHASDCITNLVQ